MRVLNNVVALDEPSVLVDERLIPHLAWSNALRTIHLSPAAWDGLALLTPEEHEAVEAVDGAWLRARADFIDEEDTPGLERFIALVDEAGMSTTRSVDLMVWLRRWRATP